MSYQPAPNKTEGGIKKTRVNDENVQELLLAILNELRVMNLHLSLLTDTSIDIERLGDDQNK